MQDNFYGGYPTEKFPSEYTKQGQAHLIQKFLEGKNDNTSSVKTQSVETQSIETSTGQTAPTPSMDIHKLMPLIKTMSQNKSLSKTELMKMMLPLLSGSNGELNELLSLMIDKNLKEKDMIDMSFESSDTKPKIASFKKVE